MMLPVRWSEQATQDLEGIGAYISQFDRSAALRLQSRIEEATLPLATYPYLGRHGREHGTRELVAHPNYIVVYVVGMSALRILSVVHARQSYP